MFVNDLPRILVYFEGTYYNYDNRLNSSSLLLHFINKILHPTVPLKSQQQVRDFLELDSEMREKTRFLQNK